MNSMQISELKTQTHIGNSNLFYFDVRSVEELESRVGVMIGRAVSADIQRVTAERTESLAVTLEAAQRKFFD